MRNVIVLFICLWSVVLMAQSTTIEGRVTEHGNQNALQHIAIKVYQKKANLLIADATTNAEGIYSIKVPTGRTYKTYFIEASNDFFYSKKVKVVVRKKDTDKKVFVNLPLYQRQNFLSEVNNKIGSTHDDKQAILEAVTNATKLADENYDNAQDREQLKYQPTPSAYDSPIALNSWSPQNGQRQNRDLPKYYEKGSTTPAPSISTPAFGETIVANAHSAARTNSIPSNYTGYKIEIITAISELPAQHEIFKRHGNIALEQKENGLYSYLIGNFTEAKVAETFLVETLLYQYPSASVVVYKNGNRFNAPSSKSSKTKPTVAPPQ